MAEISQKDQLALHEFSVRYRAEYAKENPLSDSSLGTVQDAVRSEYDREQDVKRDTPSEPASPERDREPDEPEP